MTGDSLALFSAPTRAWFESSFAAPTAAQSGTWAAAASGEHALVVAPTGSGKTLAGFLWALDDLVRNPPDGGSGRLRIVYVSPLKALAADIARNLRAPLTGIRMAAARLGHPIVDIRTALRTGDTPQGERRRFASSPPDILITTPESLFLILTSAARDALRSATTVIVDEVHALAGNKRGAHLAISLERLDALRAEPLQRLGLSATVRPPEEVARWLGGSRPARVVAPAADKDFDLSVVVPVEDMTVPGEEPPSLDADPEATEARASVWPHVEERLLELIRTHASTIVFVNSRRLAERLCGRLNELAESEVARAHHGSVSKERRKLIEEDLKAGRLPAVVATSSLELGIDMALVDLVVQVEAPGSVASGLQRIGRAGHQVGAVSRGVMFPKYRGDLVECAVIVERMKAGAIEALEIPRNPLDVLAQQIVAMVALDDWDLEELAALVRRAAPFSALPEGALEATLDMLSGRYPSHEFATLRPRLNWDRATGTLSSRSGSQSLAITSGGTIPDRGLFGVFLAGGERARVGELDEEMVYESRPGDVFVLGASSWLIEDITHDRVLVTPAPGQPGKMPFWHGDAPGRPVELGRALGRFVREIGNLPLEDRGLRLKSMGLDDFAAANLIAYLDEQRAATGAVPDDRTIVVERFRDELGDWRVCVHSSFGARVNAPWAQAIEANLGARLGLEVQSIHTDDGIAVRIPEADEAPPADSIVLDPEAVDDLVVTRVGESALFASRFRECAARALLLPRRRPGSRTPLWQQRQRSAQLLQVARRHHNFPMILETYRECLQDVFDLPALVELMAAIRRREVSVVEVETPAPSPFASSLQFGYVNAFMYEGDSPLAERRAQALSLDRSLLAEIMGHEELRDLIDRNALAELELELQWLTDDRKARAPDGLHDALRVVGDLAEPEIAARCSDPDSASAWVRALVDSRRALEIRVAGEPRVIAIEDAAVYRDALGVALPVGLPDAFAIGPDDPLGALLGRYAATHGPFVADEPAARFGLGVAVVERALGNLEPSGSIVRGEFRPDGTRREWIDARVLRRVRRRSLAAWRKEIEPAPQDALARFALAWQGVAPRKTRAASLGDLYEVIEGLQGVPLAASTLETQVLPARLPGYDPALLDQLGASGEVVWAGCGPLGRDDGWIALSLADRAGAALPEILPLGLSPLAGRVEELLGSSGALFFRAVADGVSSTDDGELLNALWELVWCGRVTNDTLAPVRAFVSGGARVRSRPAPRSRGPQFPARLGPPAGAGRWSPAPPREVDATRRLHAAAEQLLARHGLLVRGALDVERMPGGFAAVYPVLKAMEEAGRCRRGYFVDGLGGAQFALPGAVDRMRSLLEPSSNPAAVVLAATDPAHPFGAALAWPERPGGGHRPGRKVGATVVLVEGAPALYLEKGGRSLLTFTDDRPMLAVAVDALAEVARSGALGRLAVERADGASVHEGGLGELLAGAGFRFTSRGLALGA